MSDPTCPGVLGKLAYVFAVGGWVWLLASGECRIAAVSMVAVAACEAVFWLLNRRLRREMARTDELLQRVTAMLDQSEARKSQNARDTLALMLAARSDVKRGEA